MTTNPVTINDIGTLLEVCRDQPIKLHCPNNNLLITYEHGLYYIVVEGYPYSETYGPFDDEIIKHHLTNKITKYIYTYKNSNPKV